MSPLSILQSTEENQGGLEKNLHFLSIEVLKNGNYPGSDITIEQTLANGPNYSQYITSYKSGESASGAYGSNNYTIDVLNAVASIKKYKNVNPSLIGM